MKKIATLLAVFGWATCAALPELPEPLFVDCAAGDDSPLRPDRVSPLTQTSPLRTPTGRVPVNRQQARRRPRGPPAISRLQPSSRWLPTQTEFQSGWGV